MKAETKFAAGTGCSIIAIAVLLTSLVLLACNQKERQPETPVSTVVTIEQLVRQPVNYSHRLITVKGCYIRSDERSTVQPCTSNRHDEMVWVESADELYALADTRNQLPNGVVPKELQNVSVPMPEFVFRYDEKKSRAAWAKLEQAGVYPLKPIEVVVTGQFDTVAPKKANTDPYDVGHGFGHLGQYEHRLILLAVLDAKGQ